MAYGILVVEDGNELYQIIGEVASESEAAKMARDYDNSADPENEDTFCPPMQYIIWQRNENGAYAVRETIELLPSDAWNICRWDGSLKMAHRA